MKVLIFSCLILTSNSQQYFSLPIAFFHSFSTGWTFLENRIFYLLQMEALYLKSRSIINNPTYEKLQHSRFQNHQKAIVRLRTKPSIDNFNSQSPKYLKNLKKYRSAHQSIKRIFQPQLIQNQSLYRRLVDIQHQRIRKTFDQKISTEKSHKNYQREQQKKRIEYQNNKIREKISSQKKNKLTTKKLRKQFKQHDKLVSHAMRLR